MKLAEYQLAEQARALYRGLPAITLGTFSVFTLSVILLKPFYPLTLLLIWYFSTIIVLVARLWNWRQFNKQELSKTNCQSWINKMVFWTFMSGLHLGILLFLFSSEQQTYHLIIMTGIYGGFIGSAVASIALYFPAYLLFSIPPTILFTVKAVLIGNNIFQETGSAAFMYTAPGFIILFFIVLTAISRNTQFSFKRMSALAYENRKLFKQVSAQKEVAENADRSKTQFLAAASHDLRQPLHALGLFVEAFDLNKLDKNTVKIIKKIEYSTEILDDLLNSLLDISKLDANAVENKPIQIRLSQVTNSIKAQYIDTAKSQNTTISADVNDDIVVYCDTNLLSRIIRNLVDNAVKFTRNGQISINANPNGSYIDISVLDTGIGIQLEQQKHIFEEFVQINNPARDRKKGLGLGLSIVKRLCDLMSVKLEMVSEPNKGTKLTISVPRGESVANNLSLEEQTPINTEPSLAHETILVIDDEVNILDATIHVIESWQATVVDAQNIESAILKLDKLGLEPTFILADLRLRDNENGVDAINAIRDEFNKNIPAIIITGDTSPERIAFAQSIHIPVLNKPVKASELLKTIYRTLDNKGSN